MLNYKVTKKDNIKKIYDIIWEGYTDYAYILTIEYVLTKKIYCINDLHLMKISGKGLKKKLINSRKNKIIQSLNNKKKIQNDKNIIIKYLRKCDKEGTQGLITELFNEFNN